MMISRLVMEEHRDSQLSPRVQSRYDCKGFKSPLQVQINVVLFNLICYNIPTFRVNAQIQ